MATTEIDTRAVPVPRPGMRARRLPTVVGLLPLAIGLFVWQLVAPASSVSFPPPSTWFVAISGMWQSGELLPALISTIGTFLAGSAAALVVGVIVGVLVGSSRVIDRAFSPILDFFRTLPPPVVVSVSALILGITFQAGVFIVAFSVVWPILLNTASAVKTVSPVRTEMARSLNLSGPERFLKVLVPSLLPGIATGLRISLVTALLITLLVDIIGSATGIGRLLLMKQVTFDGAAVWGLLFIIGTIGYLLNEGVSLTERWFFRNWPPVGRE